VTLGVVTIAALIVTSAVWAAPVLAVTGQATHAKDVTTRPPIPHAQPPHAHPPQGEPMNRTRTTQRILTAAALAAATLAPAAVGAAPALATTGEAGHSRDRTAVVPVTAVPHARPGTVGCSSSTSPAATSPWPASSRSR